MLAVDHRITAAADFRAVTRSGRRGSARTLVAHVLIGPTPGHAEGPEGPDDTGFPGPVPTRPTRVGFVVGKTVGNSVVRHRVQRRLRHQVRECWPLLPAGSAVVVRALPAAAAADSAELGRDLTTAVATATKTASRPRPVRSAR